MVPLASRVHIPLVHRYVFMGSTTSCTEFEVQIFIPNASTLFDGVNTRSHVHPRVASGHVELVGVIKILRLVGFLFGRNWTVVEADILEQFVDVAVTVKSGGTLCGNVRGVTMTENAAAPPVAGPRVGAACTTANCAAASRLNVTLCVAFPNAASGVLGSTVTAHLMAPRLLSSRAKVAFAHAVPPGMSVDTGCSERICEQFDANPRYRRGAGVGICWVGVVAITIIAESTPGIMSVWFVVTINSAAGSTLNDVVDSGIMPKAGLLLGMNAMVHTHPFAGSLHTVRESATDIVLLENAPCE